jgi:hypothetical protein
LKAHRSPRARAGRHHPLESRRAQSRTARLSGRDAWGFSGKNAWGQFAPPPPPERASHGSPPSPGLQAREGPPTRRPGFPGPQSLQSSSNAPKHPTERTPAEPSCIKKRNGRVPGRQLSRWHGTQKIGVFRLFSTPLRNLPASSGLRRPGGYLAAGASAEAPAAGSLAGAFASSGPSTFSYFW